MNITEIKEQLVLQDQDRYVVLRDPESRLHLLPAVPD